MIGILKIGTNVPHLSLKMPNYFLNEKIQVKSSDQKVGGPKQPQPGESPSYLFLGLMSFLDNHIIRYFEISAL